jgi:hypothetical protein
LSIVGGRTSSHSKPRSLPQAELATQSVAERQSADRLDRLAADRIARPTPLQQHQSNQTTINNRLAISNLVCRALAAVRDGGGGRKRKRQQLDTRIRRHRRQTGCTIVLANYYDLISLLVVPVALVCLFANITIIALIAISRAPTMGLSQHQQHLHQHNHTRPSTATTTATTNDDAPGRERRRKHNKL